MARLFSSGFELNSSTSGVELYSFGGGTNIVQSSIIRSGSYALETVRLTNGNAITTQRLDISYAKLFFRGYVYIQTLPSNTTAIIKLSLNGVPVAAYINLTSGGRLQLFDGQDVKIGSDSSILTTGSWHKIELKVCRISNGNDIIEARLNGNVFATTNTTTLSTSVGYDTFDFGILGGAVADLFWDDIAINDDTGSVQNDYPGDSNIIVLQPNGVGDNAQWTRGGADSGANWSQVNEATPNDGANYVSSNTLNAIDDHTITPSGPAIGSNDLINVVQVGVRIAPTSADFSNASIRVRVKANSGGAVSESNAISPFRDTSWRTSIDDDFSGFKYLLTMIVLPGTLNSWEKTDVDTAQIGYRISATNTNPVKISTVWMLVDYTPSNFEIRTHESLTVSENSTVEPPIKTFDLITTSEFLSFFTDRLFISTNDALTVIDNPTVYLPINASESVTTIDVPSLFTDRLYINVNDSSQILDNIFWVKPVVSSSLIQEPGFLLPFGRHQEENLNRVGTSALASRFTAPYTGSVHIAYLIGPVIIGSPTATLRIGLQSDNSGVPSGVWLGATNNAYGTLTADKIASRDVPIVLGENASLVSGTVYHLVVQDTGMGFLNGFNLINFQPLEFNTNILYWDNDWPGSKRIDNNTAFLTFNGSSWNQDQLPSGAGNVANNAYAIQYTDYRVWGQIYSSHIESNSGIVIGGSFLISEVFKPRAATYSVISVAARTQNAITGTLFYEIRDAVENVLRSGILHYRPTFEFNGESDGSNYFWREAVLSSPLTLVYNTTYRLVLKDPTIVDPNTNAWSSTALINSTDSSNPDALDLLQYGGKDSFASFSTDSGVTWNDQLDADYPFYFRYSSMTQVVAGLPFVVDGTTTSENTSATLSIPITFDLHINDSVHVVDKPVYYDDTVFLSESESIFLAIGINVSDSTTLFELILLPSIETLNINETVTMSESSSVSLLLLTSQNESTSVLENVTITTGSLIINVHDSQSIFDDAIMGNPDLSNSVDNIVAEEENILVMESDLESVFDQVNIIDAVIITVVFTALISVTDSVGLSESVSLTIQTSVFVNVNDFEIVNELLLFTSDILIVTHDTGSTSDQVNIFPESLDCFTSDSSIVTEKVSFGVGFRVSVQDRTIASEYRWFPETPVVLGFVPGGATNDGS